MIPDTQTTEWCQKAAQGDRDAASHLLREFHRPIFAYLRRLTDNDLEASDLTQTAFIRIWQSIGRFKGASSVGTWMHRVAYCAYVDWRRKTPRTTDQSEVWWDQIPSEQPLPVETLVQREDAGRVYAAAERLPDDERQTLHLHYYQGLSIAETAEVLGIATSTVKYRLRGALDRLRRQLAESGIVASEKQT